MAASLSLVVRRLDSLQHGPHLFNAGLTIMLVGHVARFVTHNIGTQAVVDAHILHHRVQPATEGVEAMELDARLPPAIFRGVAGLALPEDAHLRPRSDLAFNCKKECCPVFTG